MVRSKKIIPSHEVLVNYCLNLQELSLYVLFNCPVVETDMSCHNHVHVGQCGTILNMSFVEELNAVNKHLPHKMYWIRCSSINISIL